MTLLLPRLPAVAAEKLLDALLPGESFEWSGFDPGQLPAEARYAATGGSRASEQELAELRAVIERTARDNGFGSKGGRNALAGFDAALSRQFALTDLLNGGEGLRDDVWSFIAVALAPDVVYWRFGSARPRYLGGIRNTFQRLWLRGSLLDRGETHESRWALLDELTEDALVQITERPSIASDGRLSLQLAEAWVRAAQRHGRGAMEPIMRQATLRLRIRNEIQALSCLPDGELSQLLDDFFNAAASSVAVVATQLDTGQPASISTAGDEPAAEVSSGESTRKRSWAIWRAR